ncbi:hypothetical protein CANCADRAFT_84868 [Tortispora caseinolytica NRRL Y-17796]|uniref:Uncharacterized protein n=1 Tax=Tortispora caseinolytica NRRL Y-17796 TaxID=767744 RepID=A0A1E4TKN3_9ASCO|nr:hypothetical protein CANCADRAFT_84868 [Tortispora caseinolytica NRRL Y-17796]
MDLQNDLKQLFTDQTDTPASAPAHDHDPATAGKWKHLFPYTDARYSAVIITATLSSLASAVLIVLMVLYTGQLFQTIQDYSYGSDFAAANDALLASTYRLLIVCAAFFPASGMSLGIWTYLSESLVGHLRALVFQKLLREDLAWFDSSDGSIANINNHHIYLDDLQRCYSIAMHNIASGLAVCIASIVVALYFSWSLTLVTLATFPVILAFAVFMSNKMQQNIEREKDQQSVSSAILQWALSNPLTVTLFNSAYYEANRFKQSNGMASAYFNKAISWLSVQLGSIKCLSLLMFVQGFWYGSYLYRRDQVSLSDIITVFLCCISAAEGFERYASHMPFIAKAKIAGTKISNFCSVHSILELLEISLAPYENSSETQQLRDSATTITVSAVYYTYESRPDTLALNNVTLSIPAACLTFIVGSSGSGKSTLANLIAGLYPVNSGKILLGQSNIAHVSKKWVRKNITYVQQTPLLFSMSIRNNILVGLSESEIRSKSEFHRVCEICGLTEFVKETPNGYDTVIQDYGSNLSGGQKQRISLARALLRDSPVLLLDEALSALDVSMRADIFQKLRDYRHGKTTLVITHNIENILLDDHVVVMENGSVKASGPFHSVRSLNSLCISGMDTARDPCTRINPVRRTSKLARRFTNSVYESNRSSIYGIAIPHLMNMQEYSLDVFTEEPEQENHGYVQSVRQSSGNLLLTSSEKDSGALSFAQLSLWEAVRTIAPGRANYFLLVPGIIAAIACGIFPAVFSYCLSHLISSLTEPADKSLFWALILICVAAGEGVSLFSRVLVLEKVADRLVSAVKFDAFTRTIHQRPGWLSESSLDVSAVWQTLIGDTENIRDSLDKVGGVFISVVFTFSASLIWALIAGWKLTLVSIAPIFGVMFVFWCYIRLSKHFESKSLELKNDSNSLMSQFIICIRSVKVYSVEPLFEALHNDVVQKQKNLGLQRELYSGLLFGLLDSSIQFCKVLCLWYGFRLVITEEYSFTSTMTVLAMIIFALVNVLDFVNDIPMVTKSSQAFRKIAPLLKLSLDEDIPSNHRQPTFSASYNTAKNVSFDSVFFKYPSANPNEEYVLKNVTVEMPKCRLTCIVGASGSGKSTLANLLARVYEPQYGSVNIGAENIRKLPKEQFRRQIGMLTQQPAIAEGTVLDNLLYSLSEHERKAISMDYIENACRQAYIHDFIISLPEGYNTILNNGLHSLSGGQAQRLCLARVLIRDPGILIMDESTSALDPETTTYIERALLELSERKTVICISHTESLIDRAHRIIRLGKGSVIEVNDKEFGTAYFPSPS